jgi:serine protease DegS
MSPKTLLPLLFLAIGLVFGYLANINHHHDVLDITSSTSTPAIAGPFSYAEAVRRAAPAVVNIHTKKTILQPRILFHDPIIDRFFNRRAPIVPRKRTRTDLGSGVIVSPNGLIITNNHVISGAEEIIVELIDGQATKAKLVGTDPNTDLAILKVSFNNLPVIHFADSSKLKVGDVTLAIGNPFGVGQTVTMGIISATRRKELGISNVEGFIQTDAAINPGNSGGALTDANGNLIGINTAIFSKSGASHGIGFAIPSNHVRKITEYIVRHGSLRPGEQPR